MQIGIIGKRGKSPREIGVFPKNIMKRFCHYRADDETYIVDLIRKVISVSLETVRIVDGLSVLDIGGEV